MPSPSPNLTRRVTLRLDVTYDSEITDAESVAIAVDRLLETALFIRDVLDEYGSPHIGETWYREEDDRPVAQP
jgi:hypothetical protein